MIEQIRRVRIATNDFLSACLANYRFWSVSDFLNPNQNHTTEFRFPLFGTNSSLCSVSIVLSTKLSTLLSAKLSAILSAVFSAKLSVKLSAKLCQILRQTLRYVAFCNYV